MHLLLALIVLSPFAEASVRALSAINEKATLDLEQIPGEDNRYYALVKNLDFPLAGQTVIIDRKKTGSNEEEFRTEGLGFSVRLGGNYARSYTKPPTAGILLFKGRDIPLKSVDRPVSLAESYARAECMDVTGQEEAQKELNEALSQFASKCGKKPTLQVDWKSFKEPGHACNGREFIKAFVHHCADADYREAITNVKEIKLSSGDGNFKKSGGIFVYGVPTKPINTMKRAFNWLENNL